LSLCLVITETYDAYHEKYRGKLDVALLRVMDGYKAKLEPLATYNFSLSIVQSSGMGKSRTVDCAARRRFTFPFNLREELPEGSFSKCLL
jgi:hypothetical protein